MEVAPALAITPDLETLQDLRLKRSTKSFHGPEAIRLGSLLEFVERAEPQFPMEFEHLVRPQAGHGEHFEHACGDILAHGLKARVITGCVKLGNDIGGGVANPWDFLQATLRHDVLQGLGEGQEIFGCPRSHTPSMSPASSAMSAALHQRAFLRRQR